MLPSVIRLSGLGAPNPESLITLGSKTGAGGQDPHGEDGVNIGAADNLNITIGEDTNIYSGRRYVNTGTTVTEVSCDDMAVSSAAAEETAMSSQDTSVTVVPVFT